MLRIAMLLVGLVVFGQVGFAKKVDWIEARVIKLDVVGGNQLLTCAKGLDDGITKDWTAKVVFGTTEIAASVIRVDKRTATVKASLTMDQAKTATVRFSPPPAP